ncbi:hypothetical protein LINPERPRIM_LOCUS30781 [Linum perenne]
MMNNKNNNSFWKKRSRISKSWRRYKCTVYRECRYYLRCQSYAS